MSWMQTSSMHMTRSFRSSSISTSGNTTTAQSSTKSVTSSSQFQAPESADQSQKSEESSTQAQMQAVQRLYLLLPNHKCPNKKNCPFHPPEEQEEELEEAEMTFTKRRSISYDDRMISEQLLAEKLAKINQQISSNLLEGNKLHFPRKTSHDITLPTTDLDRLRFDHASSVETFPAASSTREESVASDYDLDSGVTFDSCSDREFEEESLPLIQEEIIVPDVVISTELKLAKDEDVHEDETTSQVEASIDVSEVNTVDSGTIIYQVDSTPEEAQTSVTVSVEENVQVSHSKPCFKKELEYMTVTEGSQVKLECVVAGDPMPNMKWYKDQKRINSGGHYKIQSYEDGTAALVIDEAEMEDSGSYACVADNTVGSASTEAKIRVQKVIEEKPVPVFERPQEKEVEKYQLMAPPEFTATLKNKTVPESATARLNCSVTGIPNPVVRWFKDDKEIFDGPVYALKNNGGLLSLEITYAKQSAAGKYTVEASNSEGTVSCFCMLEIREDEEPEIFEFDFVRPKFVTKIKDVHVREGEDATFTCTATGKPMPTFRWQRDMINITASNHVEMESNNQGHAHLTLKKVQPSDGGLYYCMAQSKAGRTKCCAYLYVKAKSSSPVESEDEPDFVGRVPSRLSSEERGRNLGLPPSLLVMLPDTLDVVVGERLKLDCSVQGYPIPLVTWHKGDRELMYSQRHRIIMCGTLHTMEIPQVMALDKGEYIVKATNIYGTIQSSCYVNILPKGSKVTAPDYKREAMIQAAKQNLQAPYFTKHLPKTIDALKGMSVRLDCILHEGVELVQWPSSQPPKQKLEDTKKELVDEGFHGEFIPSKTEPHHPPTSQSDDGKQSVILDKPMDQEKKYERPSFQTTSQDLIQALGSEAVMECSATGNPEPEIKWYKDGQLVSASNRIKVSTLDSKHTLRIENVCTSDQGEYVCKASNNTGTETWRASLRITGSSSETKPSEVEPLEDQKLSSNKTEQEPPARKEIITELETLVKPSFMQTLPKTTTANQGDDVELTCQVTSADEVDVKWELDGRELPKDTRYQISSNKSNGSYKLSVQSVTEKDSAKYTCVVIMKDGDLIHTSTRLNVTATKPKTLQKEEDFKPHFTCELKDTLVKDGERLVLECDVDGCPRPQISWHRDGLEILDVQDFQISTIGCHCKLQINDIYPEDEGTYSCRAVNSLGEAVSTCYVTVEDLGGYVSADSASTTSSRSYEKTRIRRGDAGEGDLKKKSKKEHEEPEVAPELVVKPRRQFVDDGCNAKFKASFDGSKSTVLFWSKDGQVLSEDDHFKMYEADGFHFLEVQNVSVEDNGMYRVNVQNLAGSDSAEAELEVFEKPKLLTRSGPEWEQPLQDLTVEDGDTEVELICISKDVTQPSAKWFHNGRELVSGFHVKLYHSAQTATLIIKEIQERDAGEFKCVITGKNGVLETSCILSIGAPEIMEPPVFVKELHDMEVDEGDKLELDVEVKEVEHPEPPGFVTHPLNHTAEEGETATFTCQVKGQPMPAVLWMRGSAIIAQNQKFEMTGIHDWHSLSVHKTDQEDAGEYICHLHNTEGDVSHTFSLYVIDRAYSHGPTDVESLKPRTSQLHDLPKTLSGWESPISDPPDSPQTSKIFRQEKSSNLDDRSKKRQEASFEELTGTPSKASIHVNSVPCSECDVSPPNCQKPFYGNNNHTSEPDLIKPIKATLITNTSSSLLDMKIQGNLPDVTSNIQDGFHKSHLEAEGKKDASNNELTDFRNVVPQINRPSLTESIIFSAQKLDGIDVRSVLTQNAIESSQEKMTGSEWGNTPPTKSSVVSQSGKIPLFKPSSQLLALSDHDMHDPIPRSEETNSNHFHLTPAPQTVRISRLSPLLSQTEKKDLESVKSPASLSSSHIHELSDTPELSVVASDSTGKEKFVLEKTGQFIVLKGNNNMLGSRDTSEILIKNENLGEAATEQGDSGSFIKTDPALFSSEIQSVEPRPQRPQKQINNNISPTEHFRLSQNSPMKAIQVYRSDDHVVSEQNNPSDSSEEKRVMMRSDTHKPGLLQLSSRKLSISEFNPSTPGSEALKLEITSVSMSVPVRTSLSSPQLHHQPCSPQLLDQSPAADTHIKQEGSDGVFKENSEEKGTLLQELKQTSNPKGHKSALQSHGSIFTWEKAPWDIRDNQQGIMSESSIQGNAINIENMDRRSRLQSSRSLSSNQDQSQQENFKLFHNQSPASKIKSSSALKTSAQTQHVLAATENIAADDFRNVRLKPAAVKTSGTSDLVKSKFMSKSSETIFTDIKLKPVQKNYDSWKKSEISSNAERIKATSKSTDFSKLFSSKSLQNTSQNNPTWRTKTTVTTSAPKLSDSQKTFHQDTRSQGVSQYPLYQKSALNNRIGGTAGNNETVSMANASMLNPVRKSKGIGAKFELAMKDSNLITRKTSNASLRAVKNKQSDTKLSRQPSYGRSNPVRVAERVKHWKAAEFASSGAGVKKSATDAERRSVSYQTVLNVGDENYQDKMLDWVNKRQSLQTYKVAILHSDENAFSEKENLFAAEVSAPENFEGNKKNTQINWLNKPPNCIQDKKEFFEKSDLKTHHDFKKTHSMSVEASSHERNVGVKRSELDAANTDNIFNNDEDNKETVNNALARLRARSAGHNQKKLASSAADSAMPNSSVHNVSASWEPTATKMNIFSDRRQSQVAENKLQEAENHPVVDTCVTRLHNMNSEDVPTSVRKPEESSPGHTSSESVSENYLLSLPVSSSWTKQKGERHIPIYPNEDSEMLPHNKSSRLLDSVSESTLTVLSSPPGALNVGHLAGQRRSSAMYKNPMPISETSHSATDVSWNKIAQSRDINGLKNQAEFLEVFKVSDKFTEGLQKQTSDNPQENLSLTRDLKYDNDYTRKSESETSTVAASSWKLTHPKAYDDKVKFSSQELPRNQWTNSSKSQPCELTNAVTDTEKFVHLKGVKKCANFTNDPDITGSMLGKQCRNNEDSDFSEQAENKERDRDALWTPKTFSATANYASDPKQVSVSSQKQISEKFISSKKNAEQSLTKSDFINDSTIQSPSIASGFDSNEKSTTLDIPTIGLKSKQDESKDEYKWKHRVMIAHHDSGQRESVSDTRESFRSGDTVRNKHRESSQNRSSEKSPIDPVLTQSQTRTESQYKRIITNTETVPSTFNHQSRVRILESRTDRTPTVSMPTTFSQSSALLKTSPRSATESLQQHSPPSFPVPLQDVSVKYGSEAVLQCQVIGNPRPDVRWHLNQKQLEPAEEIKITCSDVTAQLTITRTLTEHVGDYMCLAKNSLGTVSSHCTLSLEDSNEIENLENCVSFPPKIESSTPAFVSVAKESLLVLTAESAGEPRPVVTWMQKDKALNSDGHTNIVTAGNASFLTVNEVAESDVGKMSVVVTNSSGTDQATSQISVEDKSPIQQRQVTINTKDKFEDLYEVEKEVGKGKFGVVYKCKQKTDGTVWAAKVVRCREKDKISLRREIDIMNKLRHPKLLQLWDAFESQRQMVLVMEYVGAGELFERVIGEDYVLTEIDCIHFVRQICEGMSYMHNSGILHLDLKPENILCTAENSNSIKIIDFGLAQFYKSGQSMKVLFGTPEFVAPEVINYEEISHGTDMWSLGVICYVLLSGLSPFAGDTDSETLANVTRGEFDFDDEAFEEISDVAKDFISKLLLKKKEKRILTNQCLTHTWLNQDEADGASNKRLNTERLKRFMIRRKWLKTGNAVKAVGRLLKSNSQSSFGMFSKRCSSDSLLDTSAPSTMPKHSILQRSEAFEENDNDLIKTNSVENSVTEESSQKLEYVKENEIDDKLVGENFSSVESHKNSIQTDPSSKNYWRSESSQDSLGSATENSVSNLIGINLERRNDSSFGIDQSVYQNINKDFQISTPKTADQKEEFVKSVTTEVSIFSDSVTSSSSSSSLLGQKSNLQTSIKTAESENISETSNHELFLQVPVFLKPMAKCKTYAGDVARFEVVVSGKPQISWFFEDEEVLPDSRHVLSCNENGRSFSLTIRNVDEDDEGEYTCKAVNPQGECICAAELSVLEL